jgi:hypothetical protein
MKSTRPGLDHWPPAPQVRYLAALTADRQKENMAMNYHAVSAAILLSVTAACARETEPPATPAAPGPRPNVVTVTAMDYAFEAPAQVPAGLTMFQVLMRGDQPHHVVIARLEGGRTAADLVDALRPGSPFPEWATFVGGPNAADPGGTANAMLVLEPGDYALLCFVDIPEHRPHFTRGMFRDLKVVPRTAADTATDTGTAAVTAPDEVPDLPPGDVTMRLVDYDFDIRGELRPGLTTFRVENSASQPHEVFLFALERGATAQQALAWLENPQGPPPFSAQGGVTFLSAGQANNFSVNLRPGDYGLICFIPDATDGRPHFAHGMIKQVRVR